jgi:dephospho-CoA kinase
MLLVALTGGLGSGKSAAAAMFREHGACVIEADVLARESLAIGTGGLVRVEKYFGSEVIAEDGSLNRAALAEIIFRDPTERGILESIVHPEVQRAFKERVAELPASAVVIYEIPLLAEVDRSEEFQLVIVIETPLSVRIERLAKRGFTQAEAMARIAEQATNDQRRAIADIILSNAKQAPDLAQAVKATWDLRLRKFSENLIAGLPAEPEWMESDFLPNQMPLEAQIARIANRIAKAIDGKVSVCSMTELRFASEASDLAKKLVHLGFIQTEPGRRFTSADPGRPLRLVVSR